MSATSALPLPIQKGIDFIPWFIALITKSRPGLIRSMRSDRQECLAKFLKIILLSTSLQHDGAIIYLNDRWAKPKTLKEIAEEAGISYAQAKRCLALLKQLGYISSKQIRRKNKVTGQLEVSPALRFLTRKFWKACKLWDLFKQSMAWAKKHIRRYLFMPFKTISKSGEPIKQIGGIMGNLLKTMQNTAEQENLANIAWREKMHSKFRPKT